MAFALVAALACAQRGPSARTGASETGKASYYSRALAGRATASGERYDPRALTAAHRTLPFGTIVRVERTDARGVRDALAVDVRINDRGPFVRGRVIDLSEAAARSLEMLREGVVPVRVRVLELPTARR